MVLPSGLLQQLLLFTALLISGTSPIFIEAAYFLKLADSEKDITGLKFLEKP